MQKITTQKLPHKNPAVPAGKGVTNCNKNKKLRIFYPENGFNINIS